MIAIEAAREKVEKQFIGFSPSTNSIKPVHIANGMFRAILKRTTDTTTLNRFVVSRQENGQVPKGHELESIYSLLKSGNRLDPQVTETNLANFRDMLKKVVAADGAVFPGGMDSYSAGFDAFVSNDRIGQDGGELIAEWLLRNRSPLAGSIESALRDPDDTITKLASPVLGDTAKTWVWRFDFKEVQFLNKSMPAPADDLWKGLSDAASTLALHFKGHPNKLFRLRLAGLFASFVLIRHLATLELCFVPRSQRAILPFLLDFSESGAEPTARASSMTYTLVCQSIARFYSWAFGRYLKSVVYSYDRLRKESVPVYKKNQVRKAAENKDEIREIWKLALKNAKQHQQPFTVCGQALYDMLALQAQGNPIGYLRQLGHRIGLMYPPVNTQPIKRFRIQQDLIEMLLRGAVAPAEVVDMPTLQERLWRRYGLIVGGRAEDEQLLLNAGIYQADTNSLEENRRNFAKALGRLGFADVLADGVLQVKMEVARAI